MRALRGAARSLLRDKGFGVVTVGILALAVAALIALASFANAVYWKPLPYKDADRIVAIGQGDARGSAKFSSVDRHVSDALMDGSRAFARLTRYQFLPTTLLSGSASRLLIVRIDTSFVPLFHLRASLGRTILPSELVSHAPVAMISDHLWRSRFGADSTVLSDFLTTPDGNYRIVGVLPSGFAFPWRTDAFVPLGSTNRPDEILDSTTAVLAKLQLNVSRAQAAMELTIIAKRIMADSPARKDSLHLILREEMLDRHGNRFMPKPALFLSAAGLVLIVACTNVGTLFTARAARRRHEMAIRAALGATRLHLLMLMFLEGGILGLTSATLGILLGVWSVIGVLHVLPTQGLPFWMSFGLDWRILLVGAMAALVIAFLVGLSPAIAILFGPKSAPSAQRTSVHLVNMRLPKRSERGAVLQIAIAVAFVTSALLFWRSHFNIAQIDSGYDATRVASTHISWNASGNDSIPVNNRSSELIAAVRAVPGVTAAAVRGYYERHRSLTGKTDSLASSTPQLVIDGDMTRPAAFRAQVRTFAISDDYFRTLRLPVLRGRSFGPGDAIGHTPVAIVSRRLAALAWPDSVAIGHRLRLESSGPDYLVVGVVQDVKDLIGTADGLRVQARADLYVPLAQAWAGQTELLFRSTDDMRIVSERVDHAIRTSGPWIVTSPPRSLEVSQFAELRLVSQVLGWFFGGVGALTAIIAVLGVFGVMAYSVARRTSEIGIRLALGGTTQAIGRMFVREAFGVIVPGVVLGLMLAALVSQLTQAVLVGASPFDPIAYAGASMAFALLGVAAAYFPARNAMRQDPLVAIRSE